MGSPEVQIGAARSDDLQAVLELLDGVGLPTIGVADHFPEGYVVARAENGIIGAAGLEFYENVGLLRSVAVQPARRGAGIAGRLVDDRLQAARARRLVAVYLLTTTAVDYFRRLGFEDSSRSGAPLPLEASSEFSTVCPASAACLVRIVS